MKIARLASWFFAIALFIAVVPSVSGATAARDACAIRHAFPVAKGEIDSGGAWSVVADGSASMKRSLVVATSPGGHSATLCTSGSSYRGAVTYGPTGFVFMATDHMAPGGVLFGMLPLRLPC